MGPNRRSHVADDRLGLVITFAVVAGSAMLVAFALGYVAHYDIGLSRIEIRYSALIASGSIAILLAIELCRRYRHRPK
jgi:hypothetical protein